MMAAASSGRGPEAGPARTMGEASVSTACGSAWRCSGARFGSHRRPGEGPPSPPAFQCRPSRLPGPSARQSSPIGIGRMSRIRVLIADDHAVVRAGLRMLIGTQPDMEVVGEAADGPETVLQTRAARPDVVVLDLSMPGPRSTLTIERLVPLQPSPPIPLLTM